MSTEELMQHAANFAGLRGRRRLAALIAAVKVPARPGELAGEEAAMAAFRTHAARPPVPRQSLKGTLARLLTIKVGAFCAAIVSVGGVAVAASTGTLPGGLGDFVRHPAAAGSQPGAPGPGAAQRTTTPRPTAAPSVVARCKDYLTWDPERRRKAVGGPDVRDIEDGAHSRDPNAVAHYCGQVQAPVPPSTHRSPGTAPPIGPPHRETPPPTVEPSASVSSADSPTPGPTDQPTASDLTGQIPPQATSPEAPAVAP